MRVTQTSRGVQNCALYVPCSLVVQLARVGVRELVFAVVCVMLVLIARVDIRAVSTQFFRSHFLQLEMYSLQKIKIKNQTVLFRHTRMVTRIQRESRG